MAAKDTLRELALSSNVMQLMRYFPLLFLLIIFASECRSAAGQLFSLPSRSMPASAQVVGMPVDSFHLAYRGLAIGPVMKFYSRRQQSFFWTSNFRLTAAADSVIAFIEKIRYYGLLPNDYHMPEIHERKVQPESIENIYRLEALLTDACVQMARHIRFGKATRVSGKMDSLGVALLENSAQYGGLVSNITAGEPSMRGYQLLRQGLQHLLDSLPPDQRDGVMSNSALVPYNVSHKVQAIEVNLERWRQEGQPFGSRYILVNIPAFMLYVVDDSVILESRIIVGTPRTPTPVLSSMIECFITYPYWHVPRKIAVEEYLPVIQRDLTFIERNNFDILDRKGNVLNPDSLDWKRFGQNYFPVILRQREGKENALGIIKFVFDNPYGIFLHDTNARRLFRSRVRAFSHGCIRMEKAVALAHYMVTGDLTMTSKDVERFLKEQSRHTVELQKPIPIHVRYYTCDFNNGVLHYYEDIYKKDRLIAEILYVTTGNSDF